MAHIINIDDKVLPQIDHAEVKRGFDVKRAIMRDYAMGYHCLHLLALTPNDLRVTTQALRSLPNPPHTRVNDSSPLTLGETIALVERVHRLMLANPGKTKNQIAAFAHETGVDMRDPLLMLGCEAGICPGQPITFKTNFGYGKLTKADVRYVGSEKGRPIFEYRDAEGLPRWAYFSQAVKGQR
jgi:hypothetical protein